jgi:sugar/nucleoside kinase (ribokinase family)
VPDTFLQKLKLEKNRMFLVDQARHSELLTALTGAKMHAEPGGSCANTIQGIAQLGASTAYCGKVGGDEHGKLYVKKLEGAGVKCFMNPSTLLTGSCVVLVTPDAARTMNVYLGAAQDLKAADIPVDAIQQSKRLYITGYVWDTDGQKEAAMLALRTAKAAKVPVAFSLADPFCVNRHRADFEKIIGEYVDILFANREEALAQTGTTATHDALAALRKQCDKVAITLSAAGALIANGKDTIYVDPFPTHPKDTTGAGDAFAAGYLYGMSTGASAHQCGRLGSRFASQVIQQIGPRLSGDVRKQLAPVL